jgi:ABC-type multidrug transport system ATPase subunit
MDQPTANMDTESKKVFWEMLKKHHDGRVFVFTTNSMEEADVIADRKAVLSHGVLKCCGSSQFLRSRFSMSPATTDN